jgi:type 1 glutamine amidotransferase
MIDGRSGRTRVAPWLVASVVSLGLTPAATAQQFKVIAFYNGNFDQAHIAFVNEANPWFTARAAEHDFSYTATTNWSLLNTGNLAQYKVVMFLDDLPPASVRAAFQTYMQNGGGFMGFHVSAFNTNPASWDWYHNQFLGTGAFRNNTWGPTTAVLRVEDRTHPSTVNLPATFTSAVSEWYSWNRDLRTNPNIRILASVDPSSFPLGTDPNQTWTSGYFPILWTNRNYRMIYANFGHNAMNYQTNTPLSSTFASATQNRFIIDSLLWLGGGTVTPTPTPAPSPTPTPGLIEVTPGGASVSASTNDGNAPANTVDDNLNTRWSASGNPQWIQYDLGLTRRVANVKVAWYSGNTRRASFDVQIAGATVGPWTTVLANRQSGGTSTALETYDFADTNGRYVRIVGHGNSVNLWNSITETQIFAVP